MNESETFQQLLKTEVTQAKVIGIAINLFLAALLGLWIGRVYVRYGTALSNRRAFARNFVLLTMTTMLIISFIQADVALSLGMIGALSIVRFRSAIKEPEELCFLFLAISAGIGLGANQRLMTIGGIAVIIFVVWLKHLLDQRLDGRDASQQNVYLTVTTNRPELVTMDKLGELLASCCALHRLKRLDQAKGVTEACYLVEPKTADSMNQFESDLRKVDDAVSVSLLDTRGGLSAVG